MANTENKTEKKLEKRECAHQYTFKKEYLYQDVNVIFSRKICEKCGKEIVLSRRSRNHILLFVVGLVLLLFLCETQLKNILPDVSYAAKGLIVVFLFCAVLAVGLYQLMNRATYVTYVPRQRNSQYREAYEKARQENDERTRRRYEEAAMRREEKRLEKARSKKR